jgi:hypothetical protein
MSGLGLLGGLQTAHGLLLGQGRLDLARTDQSGFGQELPDGFAFKQDAFQGVLGDVLFSRAGSGR